MTDRELDRLAFDYLDAVDRCDDVAVERFWALAETDPAIEALLHNLHASSLADAEVEEQARMTASLADSVRTNLPTASIETGTDGSLTLAMVADALGREMTTPYPFNETLRSDGRAVPELTSLSKLLAWAQAQFGEAPEDYWRSFRNVAMRLAAVRGDADYGLAARTAKPKRLS